jgi:hypothetical protein
MITLHSAAPLLVCVACHLNHFSLAKSTITLQPAAALPVSSFETRVAQNLINSVPTYRQGNLQEYGSYTVYKSTCGQKQARLSEQPGLELRAILFFLLIQHRIFVILPF